MATVRLDRKTGLTSESLSRMTRAPRVSQNPYAVIRRRRTSLSSLSTTILNLSRALEHGISGVPYRFRPGFAERVAGGVAAVAARMASRPF